MMLCETLVAYRSFRKVAMQKYMLEIGWMDNMLPNEEVLERTTKKYHINIESIKKNSLMDTSCIKTWWIYYIRV